MSNRHLQVRRIYDDPADSDGRRVLVDRLWPRGVSNELAALDDWCKQIAPSTDLREWYGHVPERYEEFADRYRRELTDPERSEELASLKHWAAEGTVTLMTAAKLSDISEATVLADLLRDSK